MEPYVVVIDKPFMGEPNRELGTILLKGFLNTILQFERQPEAILFYNEGVLLEDDSVYLELLNAFSEKEVRLLYCGTCLDYYEKEARLGARSSMKEILQLQMNYKTMRP